MASLLPLLFAHALLTNFTRCHSPGLPSCQTGLGPDHQRASRSYRCRVASLVPAFVAAESLERPALADRFSRFHQLWRICGDEQGRGDKDQRKRTHGEQMVEGVSHGDIPYSHRYSTASFFNDAQTKRGEHSIRPSLFVSPELSVRLCSTQVSLAYQIVCEQVGGGIAKHNFACLQNITTVREAERH